MARLNKFERRILKVALEERGIDIPSKEAGTIIRGVGGEEITRSLAARETSDLSGPEDASDRAFDSLIEKRLLRRTSTFSGPLAAYKISPTGERVAEEEGL
ncbi:hypothetical protein LCGC14_1720390 [marine sediment metagenome]|uniref:Uncharacterized protein n=1 Tax=marine sediment metagenome TaxID=412755 RepID=A0A0F9HCU2_9ZZZZ